MAEQKLHAGKPALELFLRTMESNDTKYYAFLALVPPHDLAIKIKGFQRGKHKPPLKWISYEKLHLTLFFWPGVSVQEFNDLYNQIESQELKNILPKDIESTINGYHFFLGAKVLYLREKSDCVYRLHNLIEPELKKISYPFLERSEFIPHWTFARKFNTKFLHSFKDYFFALDNFNIVQMIPEIALFLSKDGEYHKRVLISTDNNL